MSLTSAAVPAASLDLLPPIGFERLARLYDGAPAREILAFAVAEFGADLTVTASMQDGVLVDLAARTHPGIEIAFLDTGFHFAETLETARRLEARYALNLVELKPGPGAADYRTHGIEACCAARKVGPLDRHLAGKRAWVTGLRRAESPTRAAARALEWDDRRGIVKVNPLVDWTDDDVEFYGRAHDVISNPLRDKGYGSIGCAPCTVPGAGRDGRWAGSGKLECGLHDRLGEGQRV